MKVERSVLLAALEPLGPDGWARTAIIKGAGKELERSVLFYGRWLVEHERPHLNQIERIASVLRG